MTMEAWPGAIPLFRLFVEEVRMALFVEIDVSKDKFDACGIGDYGERIFFPHCQHGQKGV
jgi:hypothetical protein